MTDDTTDDDNPAGLEVARDGDTVLLVARDGAGGGTAYPLPPHAADTIGRELLHAARDADDHTPPACGGGEP